jgi:hypothetical protein
MRYLNAAHKMKAWWVDPLYSSVVVIFNLRYWTDLANIKYWDLPVWWPGKRIVPL